jgi:gamma-glutamyltranspeptidase/glutathione hydrolase
MDVQLKSLAGYVPAPHVQQHWQVTKPAASGKRGMVVAQARDAAEAGLAVLEAGGNAIDAAVATALALTVAEPWNSGIGGIGFAVVHRAGQAKADVVDFGPRAPGQLTPAHFKLTGKMSTIGFKWPEVEDNANLEGPLSVAVPSSVAGYEKLHSTWGRLPLADVIAPAVALAKRGLPRDWFTAYKLAMVAKTLRRYPTTAAVYLDEGLPWAPGELGGLTYFKQGNLAGTLERLQQAGLRDYYEGDIAAAIVRDMKAVGGVIDADDLRTTQAVLRPATEVAWRNGKTLQLATGLTAAPTLAGVLEQMRGVTYGAAPDAAWFSAFAGVMKDAYAKRLGADGPGEKATCTTHLTVCDADGTMVAMTTTLMSTMGSCVVLPETGILLNNGVLWFDPRPGLPNSLAPGKRPLTNMCPVIMSENGRPVLAAGASGGRKIMGAVFQLMTYVADFGMPVGDAAHFPRIDVSGPDQVVADDRLPADVIAALEADVVEHSVIQQFACPNVIVRGADGAVQGVSDAMSPWSAALAQ